MGISFVVDLLPGLRSYANAQLIKKYYGTVLLT